MSIMLKYYKQGLNSSRDTYCFVDCVGIFERLVSRVSRGGSFYRLLGDGGVCKVHLGGLLGEHGSAITRYVRGTATLCAVALHVGDVTVTDRTWNGYSATRKEERKLICR